MRFLSMLILILLTATAFAAGEGEKVDVDGQKFTHQKGVWVHDALGSNYIISDKYSTVYRDKLWMKWYQEGSPTLKKIMDLGQNVVFSYTGADGKLHTYAVFESTKAVKKAIAGGSGAVASGLGVGTATTATVSTAATAGSGGSAFGLSPVAAAAIGGGIVVGAVLINSDSNNNETSESRR